MLSARTSIHRFIQPSSRDRTRDATGLHVDKCPSVADVLPMNPEAVSKSTTPTAPTYNECAPYNRSPSRQVEGRQEAENVSYMAVAFTTQYLQLITLDTGVLFGSRLSLLACHPG